MRELLEASAQFKTEAQNYRNDIEKTLDSELANFEKGLKRRLKKGLAESQKILVEAKARNAVLQSLWTTLAVISLTVGISLGVGVTTLVTQSDWTIIRYQEAGDESRWVQCHRVVNNNCQITRS